MRVKKSIASISVSRDNLRHRTATVVRRLLIEGRIEGRVNESELSAQIGVSRTPLREALLGLEKEGLLVATPWRGFNTVPLSAKEARDVYPILSTLEVLALKQRGRPTPTEFAVLTRINNRLEARLEEPAEALELDTEWHTRLLEPCGNTRLLEMIRHLKHTTYKYEYAYMQQARRVVVSVGQHRQIISALQKNDLDLAAAILEENWQVTLRITESWLMARDGVRKRAHRASR